MSSLQELEQAESFARRCYELARERADNEWHREAGEGAGPGEVYIRAHREMLARHAEWRKARGELERGRKAALRAVPMENLERKAST